MTLSHQVTVPGSPPPSDYQCDGKSTGGPEVVGYRTCRVGRYDLTTHATSVPVTLSTNNKTQKKKFRLSDIGSISTYSPVPKSCPMVRGSPDVPRWTRDTSHTRGSPGVRRWTRETSHPRLTEPQESLSPGEEVPPTKILVRGATRHTDTLDYPTPVPTPSVDLYLGTRPERCPTDG